MSEKIENTPLEFSTIDPMTEAAGLEAVLGMINPKEDLGQVENDSVPEAELEEDFVEESVDDEVEETLDQTEDDELEESDEPEMSGDIELDDSEYDYLVSAKEFLNENGLDDIEKIKSGILMQGDYTRKTQALADERKAFEANSKQSLEETTKLLQIAHHSVLPVIASGYWCAGAEWYRFRGKVYQRRSWRAGERTVSNRCTCSCGKSCFLYLEQTSGSGRGTPRSTDQRVDKALRRDLQIFG